jgi:hypothetical protein
MGGPKQRRDEVVPRSPRPVETRKRSLLGPGVGGRGMRVGEWKRGVLGPLARPITRLEPPPLRSAPLLRPASHGGVWLNCRPVMPTRL